MRTAFWTVALAALLHGGAPAVRADVWDAGTDNDNSSTSDNEMVNGLDQVHDMAAQQGGTVEDVDWFPFRPFCRNSYEILLDGITGAVGNVNTGSPALDLLASDGTTLLYGSQPVSSLGIARRLIYACVGADTEITYYVRVSHPDCGLSCASTDQYHIHFRDTTALIPRFNNSATQVSVLVLQNSSSATVSVNAEGYDTTGTMIGGVQVSLTANQVAVVNLSTANSGSLAGKSGGLKIINTAPYGALAGKVVAVEPATGFTFDTPLVYKPPEE
jgi:hypothetical protein